MECRKTFGNMVLIKLDPENDLVKTEGGFSLYIDTSYDPEKHSTVTGTVCGLPSKLTYTGEANKGMPWLTDIEVKCGDHVIIYYLAVVNAFKPEQRRCFIEGNDRYVAVEYRNIFAVYGEGFVKPINGYCLIEACEDPEITSERGRMKAIGMELVVFNKPSNTDVVYGKVRYISKPNRDYVDPGNTDQGADVVPGDVVILRRISDVPLHYDLHAKIDKGTKLWRVHRRQILAKVC